MKERPILFKGDMVRAILEGRKTQTRRVVKLPIKCPDTGCELAGCELAGSPFDVTDRTCPYGQLGDGLWVRETFGVLDADHQTPDCKCYYKADCREGSESDSLRKEYGYKYKPSIHMPRWASRITLEIVSVRVERLNEISEADSAAEGITDGGCMNCGNSSHPVDCGCGFPLPSYKESFISLWESINGAGSWQQNPWVWVVEFKKVAEG